MPSTAFRRSFVAILWVALALGAAGDDEAVKPSPPALAMSPAVACRQIDGYEQFEPLPGAAITSDEKLKVYYRPTGYAIEQEKGQYLARFKQDVAIRRKGEKKVLWKKDKILEYEARSDRPPYQIFLTNSVGLKGLPPGEYELDITLRDALRAGSSATQSLAFRIVPAPVAPPDEDDPGTGFAPVAVPKGPDRPSSRRNEASRPSRAAKASPR